jgi:hypothetical protein
MVRLQGMALNFYGVLGFYGVSRFFTRVCGVFGDFVIFGGGLALYNAVSVTIFLPLRDCLIQMAHHFFLQALWVGF